MRRICSIFADLGFQVYRSREVEDDLTNFELLNMPPHHPARDMWDTFHTTTQGVLLRTHTSPGQIHVMREYNPRPIRVILPGMVYRYEQVTINGGQVKHEADGSWKIAIAPRDPGLPNWVSTAGHPRGRIWFRWFLAESLPERPRTRVEKIGRPGD